MRSGAIVTNRPEASQRETRDAQLALRNSFRQNT
jgi:hypothetical protein